MVGLFALENEMNSIKRSIHDKANNHDVASINRKLDSLEHSMREISSQVNGMEFRLQELEQDRQQRMEENQG